MSRIRIGVLASGGGSNLQALLDHQRALGERRAADVVLVVSDRAGAGALERARRAGIVVATHRSSAHPDAPDLATLLDEHRIDLVVLAGYLRMVPPGITRRFAGRMINVHPALLPAFGGPGMYGQRVHRAVLAAAAPASGATVHYVDEIYDHGAIIAQWPVPVLATDDEHALAARVLRAEHLLFPRVVQAVAAAMRHAAASAHGAAAVHFTDRLPSFDPELDDASLAQQLDDALAR